MPKNFNSTCNSKMSHIKNRMDNFDCQKLPQSESKVRETSKPVKIAQLLGFSKQLNTGLRDSTVKISQPERITPYVKNTSTQKKNKPNIVNRFHHNERNVRRNLKFTETPPTTRRTKQFVRASTTNLHNKSTMNERSLQQTHNRKSFILPPNSIKNMHVKQNKFNESRSVFSHLSQTRILTDKSVSKYPRISEESEDAEEVPINNPVVQEKNNKASVIQHTSSQTFRANDRPAANILYSSSSHSNAGNDAVEKATHKHADINEVSDIDVLSNQKDNITINKLQVPSMHNIDARKDVNLYSCLNLATNVMCTPGVEKITIEDIYAPLQAIKKMSESCADLQRSIDDDHEYVTLSKKELTILISNLESHQNLICRLEENISSLKLASINVMNLLSVKIVNKITNDNKVESKEQMIGNFNANAKVISDASTISSPSVQTIVTAFDHNSKDTSKTPGSDVLVCAKTDVSETEDHVETQPSRQNDFTPLGNNKENEKDTNSSVKHSKSKCETRRRSARLMAKALMNSNAENESFVNLEQELNIVSKAPTTPIVSRVNYTPLTSGRKDKKIGRPWKEYMAMKSRMSCLLTPNTTRFNSAESKNNMHSETGGIRSSLSSKILADLHNLYSESPDL